MKKIYRGYRDPEEHPDYYEPEPEEEPEEEDVEPEEIPENEALNWGGMDK